jgi:putative ABC transport system permease protein
VRWATFQPNFFVIFEPGVLDPAPKQFVMLANVPTPQAMATLQRDVVRQFPSVSSVDLSLVQRTVGDVIGKVTMAVRFLAILSLGLSVPVLFSAVAATRRQRLREGVLLKTLGASRRQIRRIMLSEYALLGALGATSGIVLSIGASWALLRFAFEQSYTPTVLPLLAVAAMMIALSVGIGLLTGREVFAQTPMAALRDAA